MRNWVFAALYALAVEIFVVCGAYALYINYLN